MHPHSLLPAEGACSWYNKRMSASPPMPHPHRLFDCLQPGQLLAAAMMIGLGLRLLLLGSKSLWLDEARSLLFAQAGAASVWAGKSETYHPPLYYILLQAWAQLGTSEWALRLSSALVGSLSIPLIYALAHRLAGRTVALSAAWLAALSPLLVWYAQELRSYSLLTVLGLLASLALVNLIMHPARGSAFGWWLLFVVAMSAAFYTHYNAVLLIPVQLLLILLSSQTDTARWRTLVAWLVAWSLIGLLYWPWLASPGAAAFVSLVTGAQLYPAEYLAFQLGISPHSAMFIIGAALIALSGAVLMAVAVVQRRRPSFWAFLRTSAWLRRALVVLFILVVIMTVIPRGYAVKRLVMALWPYVLIAVAWVFPWEQQSRRSLAMLLGASLVATLINITVIPKDQWRELVTALAAQAQPGDVVWVQPAWEVAPFTYYLPDGSGPAVSGPPADADKRAAALQQGRIWHVYQTYEYLRSPDHTVEQLLAEQMEAVQHLDFYRVHATLYQRRPSD